ncbi:hypothetical protein FB107DRAFT_291830 [Schizophyllum commune]
MSSLSEGEYDELEDHRTPSLELHMGEEYQAASPSAQSPSSDSDEELLAIPDVTQAIQELEKRKEKRKRGRPAKEKPSLPDFSLSCDITVYAYSERDKPKAKKDANKSLTIPFTVNNSTTFDDLSVALLKAATKHSRDDNDKLSNYNVTFTIPYVSSQPLSLDEADDFAEFITRGRKGTRGKTATIIVQRTLKPEAKKRDRQKENTPSTTIIVSDSGDSDGDEPPKKKKKKDEKKKSKVLFPFIPSSRLLTNLQAPRHADIAAVNLAKTQAITTLPGVKSEFCYVKGDTHIALSHVLFDKWAAATLAKGPDGSYRATTEMPPNDEDFRKILGNDNTGTGQSALVLRRQALQKEVPAPISAPPVTFQFGSFPPYPGVGPQSFGLSQQVREKLEQNGYLTTDAFEFTSTQDLKDSKLLLGEIAQVRSAVKRWSISMDEV